MRELETKLRLPLLSADRAAAVLTDLGVALGPPRHQTDVVYAKNPSDVSAPVVGTVVVRVRTDGDRASLTLKKRRDSDLDRTELEVGVDDPLAVEAILSELGQTRVVVVRKTRREGRLDDMTTVTLDEVEGLGTFIEVEVLADETDAASTALSRATGQIAARLPDVVSVDQAYDRLLLESHQDE